MNEGEGKVYLLLPAVTTKKAALEVFHWEASAGVYIDKSGTAT
jgi:hypothetical protein